VKNKIILGMCSLLCSVVAYGTPSRKEEVLKHFYHNRKVLVTGGCGFIGSTIAEQLVTLGAHVTILDNLSTGYLRNIESFKDKVVFIQGDIRDKETCIQATHGVKTIFHLAAFVSVPKSVADPELCHTTNIDGTFNILEAARHNAVERVVFSSSSAVYGPTNAACTEDMSCAPISPYGYSKWTGELLCQQYSKVYGIDTVMLRYFNVYGERQDPNAAYAAAMAKFNHQMKQNLPITIFGDGTQTRDFVPVEQVAESNLLLGMLSAERVSGQAFNIAQGKSISILDLVDRLKHTFPTYTGAVLFGPERPGDVKHTRALVDKYEKTVSVL
jgi:nucleoside-diphosphate-sugar epimerase